MDMENDFLSEKKGLQEMGNQKMAVSDENAGNKSDNFIIDLELFSNGLDKEPTTLSATSTNSRITLQRSLSRKVSQRGADSRITDRDPLATSSPSKAAQVVSTPEKPLLTPPTLPMGSPNHFINGQQLPQHQITIKTGGINTIADGRLGKRSSFKRSSHSWFSNPKKILLFFATLSSIGTMLLIYFTLSMSKPSEEEGLLDWQ